MQEWSAASLLQADAWFGLLNDAAAGFAGRYSALSARLSAAAALSHHSGTQPLGDMQTVLNSQDQQSLPRTCHCRASAREVCRPMLSSSSVRPNQSSQGNTQHTPSGPVTSTLSRYQSLPSSVCVSITCMWQCLGCQGFWLSSMLYTTSLSQTRTLLLSTVLP